MDVHVLVIMIENKKSKQLATHEKFHYVLRDSFKATCTLNLQPCTMPSNKTKKCVCVALGVPCLEAGFE